MNTLTNPAPVAEQPERLDHVLVTAFLESVPDRIYFKDERSRFIAVSKSTAIQHQMLQEDMIGKTDFDMFSAAHARPAYEDEQNIMRTGKPILAKLEKEIWADGRITYVLSSKMPLRDAGGEIIGTFGISRDVTESKRLEQALEKAQKDLVDASHQAGMAEVATGVLHNVGNVLNSVNVTASVIGSAIRQSKVESLGKVAAMLREHGADLGTFLTQDPKGRLIPGYLESVALHAAEERERLLKEIAALQKNIDHIKEIVNMQQAYATVVGVLEPQDPAALMEDALRMNSGALTRHAVTVVRDFHPVPMVLAEKGKVLQILVNLISNAKYACDEGRKAETAGPPEKTVTLRIDSVEPGRVRLIVQDNGDGIPPENLTRIFAHGFTTRAKGHGFGLHSSAIAAKEMKGSLHAFSEGRGRGATFVLELPAAPGGATAMMG